MKTQKPRWMKPLLCITACAVLTLLAGWDAVAHHGGRLVYPMQSYSFQPSDIPMLLVITLDILCVLYLLITAILAQKKLVSDTNRTRKLNPWLGIFGLLGFLGFLGFWTWPVYGMYTPFCFFVFFGFFGFFFEGKMSNTLMDERYRENASRAQLDAYGIGMKILFLLMVLAGQGKASPETTLMFLLIGVSLILALTLFLSVYLLYRYDRKEMEES